MKSYFSPLLATLITVLAPQHVCAFVPWPAKRTMPMKPLHEYVPDGMAPEQWRKLKEKEMNSKANKNFGAFGPSSFKSRSLQAFQKDLEKGKAGHLLPVFNAKEKLKLGNIKEEDIPYMQRGGSWDNRDVRGAKKKQWTTDDKKYKANWEPGRPDWTGTVERRGPSTANNKTQKPNPSTPKKRFGLF